MNDLDQKERDRLDTITEFEREAGKQGYTLVAGIDEAGRGPLAGPVVAAACLSLSSNLLPGVNDSKKLTPIKRQNLFQKMQADPYLVIGIGIVEQNEIDRINILEATKQAMALAVDDLKQQPDYLLIDGMSLDIKRIPCQKIIRGDQRSYLIALASIAAKETRDALMLEWDKLWPEYGFARHKGYGTREHIQALHQYGPCPLHRRSFAPCQ